jgi:hypothetical protein
MMPSRPTEYQKRLAALLNLDISNDSRRLAAARIHDAVQPAIEPQSVLRRPTDPQKVCARDLGIDFRRETFRTCFARIADELDRRTAALRRRYRITPGMPVLVAVRHFEGTRQLIRLQHAILGTPGKNAGLTPSASNRIPPSSNLVLPGMDVLRIVWKGEGVRARCYLKQRRVSKILLDGSVQLEDDSVPADPSELTLAGGTIVQLTLPHPQRRGWQLLEERHVAGIARSGLVRFRSVGGKVVRRVCSEWMLPSQAGS